MINTIVNEILGMYPKNGHFIFSNGPIINAPANLKNATSGVPKSEPGLYFIYAPYSASIKNTNFLVQRINGILYTLIYIGKAGMDKNGINKNNNAQMLYGRINNVGVDNVRRSKIWTNFMNNHGVSHLLFKWVVTLKQLNPATYDNCFFLEQAFYNIWKAVPEFKPELNE